MMTPEQLAKRFSEQSAEFDELMRFSGQLEKYGDAAVAIFGEDLVDNYNLRAAVWTERQTAFLQQAAVFRRRGEGLYRLPKGQQRAELLRWLEDGEALIEQNERNLSAGRALMREIAPKMALMLGNTER